MKTKSAKLEFDDLSTRVQFFAGSRSDGIVSIVAMQNPNVKHHRCIIDWKNKGKNKAVCGFLDLA
jgi:hypothetical protein